MNAQIEGAEADVIDTATLPQDPSLRLTSDLMESARLVDEAFEAAAAALVETRNQVGGLMASFKAVASFVGDENLDLKARLESLNT